MILRLLYRSAQRYELSGLDMIRLLLQAREHNARLGIGGMLLLRDGVFMQLLEGPVDAVEALYAQIALDPRHAEAQVLVRDRRDRPLLPAWRMAWAEAPLDEGRRPMFAGLETDDRAVDLLAQAGDDRVAQTMQAFLRGEPIDAGAAPGTGVPGSPR